MTKTTTKPPDTDVKRPPPKPKRQSKFEALMAQGSWIEKLPYFALPTPQLQSEWEEALAKRIRDSLSAAGFRRVGAPNREYPLHSALLRERIDSLAFGDYFLSAYKTPESGEETRMSMYADIEKLATLKELRGTPLDDEALSSARNEADEQIKRGQERRKELWRKAFETYRSMLREPSYWRGTRAYRTVFPHDGPPLPDGPPPPPVYVCENADIVLLVKDGLLRLWAGIDPHSVVSSNPNKTVRSTAARARRTYDHRNA